MTDSEELEKWDENHRQALNMSLATDLVMPNLAKKHLLEGRRKALDVGCGIGVSMNVFVISGFEVMGVDQSQFAIGVIRQRFPHLKFYHSRAQQIDQIFGKEFDLAYTVAVLQHSYLHRKREIIEAIKNVVKDDGFILTAESCGGGNYPDDYDSLSFHPYVLTKAGWIRFMNECGCEMVEVVPNVKDYIFLWRKKSESRTIP